MRLAVPLTSARRVKRTIKAKQDQRAQAIHDGLQLAGASTPQDDYPYLAASACTITEKIRNRHWTVLRVMQAYVRSAARAHERTNCLTEVIFVQALYAAECMDLDLSRNPQDKFTGKLLLGLPVSLKDENDVVGIDSSIGFVR